MLRELARIIGISTAVMLTFVGLGMWTYQNPRTYGEFINSLGDVIFSLPIGMMAVVLAIVVCVILVFGVPVTIYEKAKRWRARREDGNLGRYDDPDYVEQRD